MLICSNGVSLEKWSREQALAAMKAWINACPAGICETMKLDAVDSSSTQSQRKQMTARNINHM